MSELIALSPEHVIFAQGEDLRTTSLKVAEAFEKRHSDVLRAIEKITTQVSDSFNKRNFALIEINTEVGFGTRKDPAYEMTKDGFMIVVMSFTGEKAMAIKEWYINAFNAMQAKLFPKTPYGLKALPLKKTKIAVEGGLSLATQDELKNMIHDLAATLPKDKQASAVIGMWSALGTHFEAKALKGDSKLAAYKFIPEAARLECVSLLARLPFNDMVTLSNTDMMALIDSRVHEQLKALPAPAPLEGEMLQKPQHNKISFDLAPLRAGESRRWLITQLATEAAMFHPLLPGQQVVSMYEAVKLLQQHDYLVVKKSELLGKLEA
jgi:Rha family phage regulatory protein